MEHDAMIRVPGPAVRSGQRGRLLRQGLQPRGLIGAMQNITARKQAELASLEHELRAAQAAQFSELPAQLGVETIDDVIKTLAPHASPRLKGALAKAFGGTDGHKYVNGVLDKCAGDLRPVEVAARQASKRGA